MNKIIPMSPPAVAAKGRPLPMVDKILRKYKTKNAALVADQSKVSFITHPLHEQREIFCSKKFHVILVVQSIGRVKIF